ncbi:type II secretion system major pseudopilin GspG [Algisphaera agarilytica]|uniref:Type II secretion system core protein G n=1 Tax=Algisphaera agarilytica TaxID=1385975 RepID=A0A7X0H8S6_9BACT|nr:type II secretion system major pseudopilin GspG [Algisphaera agarilytica]MBB6429894.1 general secretion pathway protein G [Algisphaera agarilytica]
MKRISRTSGFTLIEIMVVVIVIGVIAALIVPNLFDRAGKAKRSVAKQQVGSLETAIQLFQQDYGRFPDTLEELASPPADVEGASPPSIKQKDLIDPWGNPFLYRYPGNNWTFDLLSTGADGQEGGEGENADITNY